MKMKDIIKVADFFTIGNLTFGMLTIFYAILELFPYAAIFLLIAVLFDYLDGKIARMSRKATEQGKQFGKQLDSLADIVSFGVAPAVFGFALGLQEWWHILILLFFVAAGMLRLSRFNVTESSGYFEGIPITVNGFLFPLLFSLWWFFPYALEYLEYILAAYLIMSFAMLSSIKIKKML